MSSPPSVDIAIVNYFSALDVRRCLERLGPWMHGTVWLVDNSQDAAEFAALLECTQARPWVRLIDSGGNIGFGRACNVAFEQSTSPLFLLLNPDAWIAPADVQALAQAMNDDPRLGAVSPRVYWNEARTFLLPLGIAQTPWTALAQALAPRARRLARWAAARSLATQRQRMASTSTFEVAFLSCGSTMLRRQAALAAGGLFDPDYFMFFEDSDLSVRLRRSGWRLAIVPTAAAVHEYRHKAFKAGMMAQSRSQYFRKLYPWFHSLSAGLERLDALARPVPLQRWFEALPAECRTLTDFTSQTNARGVVAFSSSGLMMPAAFRPLGASVRSFDEEEWALLEPAGYVALMQDEGEAAPARWVHFERVP
jgi:GT2 family glycosyltransferase